jgi:hypothetical protein
MAMVRRSKPAESPPIPLADLLVKVVPKTKEMVSKQSFVSLAQRKSLGSRSPGKSNRRRSGAGFRFIGDNAKSWPQRLRVKPNLLKQINLICPVQSFQQKYSASPLPQINTTSPAVPPPLRGVSRSSRTWAAGCDGRGRCC